MSADIWFKPKLLENLELLNEISDESFFIDLLSKNILILSVYAKKYGQVKIKLADINTKTGIY